MPQFLKINPIKEWVDLWKQAPMMFWKKYWSEKKLGRLPPNFGYHNHKANKKKKGKKGGKQSESDGEDAKVDKKAKKKAKKRQEQQFDHDATVSKECREEALAAFMNKTGHDGNIDDSKTTMALKEHANERFKKESKKRESKRKQKETNLRKKHEQQKLKKDFIRQIEENSIRAQNPLLAFSSQLENATQ